MTEDYETSKDGYDVSTRFSRLDLDTVHAFLTHSYWKAGVSKELVVKGAENSLNFGLYREERQVGYARVVSDYVSFAFLFDVFVLPSFRGRGLGTFMIESVVNCPHLRELRRFYLGTRDAHGLYAKFGFEQLEDPSSLMVLTREMPWFDPNLIEE
jgi:GNAT superfamily N-acetyltransferase